jgi:cytochrome c oxidase subunit IV
MAHTTQNIDPATSASEPAHHVHDAHAHPTEKQYWLVFITLVILTALEVGWSYMGFEGIALIAPLLVMMTIKFFLVAGAFMHLYFDLKILNGRMFTMAFGGALTLALAVYFAVFAAFRFHI